MKVAVIGCAPSEIICACHLTISRLAKEGHSVYAIIAPSKASESSSSSSESQILPRLAAIGITQAYLLQKFDYSAITQVNADAVNSYIKDIEPSLVIMPSWKSPNNMRRILARTSLIACRGIGTILMYELDAKNTSFNPHIIFEVSSESAAAPVQGMNHFAESSTEQQLKIAIDSFTNNSMLENKAFKTTTTSSSSSYGGLEEKFESHRTLLLEDQGLF
jgi:hypothetical protein